MALNDIKVPKENASGTFDEIALAASDLKLGTTANLPIKTGASGVLEAGSFGTSAGTFCQGNDARLSDSRTPSSTLAHKASHATGGTDALAPSDISAAWQQTISSITVSSAHQLTAARNQRVLVNSTNVGSGAVVYLPTSGNAEGDRLEVACVGLTTGTLTVQTGQYNFTVSVSISLDRQRTFVYTSSAWMVVGTVEQHTHPDPTPSFSSSAFRVTEPSGLATNQLAFSLANITAGATRTLTIANRSGVNVVSDTSAGSGSDVVNNIVSLTQAEYNAIGSPDAATLFLITDP
jgi:hypothetical protein